MGNKARLGEAKEWREGQLKSVDLEGKSIVVARTSNGFCAVVNKCPHMGLPIGGGRILGDEIVCPWHNSRFNMCTGENQDWAPGILGLRVPAWSRSLIALGKKPAPIQIFRVVEEDGVLYAEV